MTGEIQFPTFLRGTVSSLRRSAKRVGQQWATAYREQQRFPEPKLEVLTPGSLIYLKLASDLAHERQEWRLYFVQIVAGEICEALDYQDYARVSAEFEAYTAGWPWGALDAAVEHPVPNSAPVVARRIEAVLGFWEPLSTLRYVDRTPQAVSLDAVMTNHFSGMLEMWLPARSGNIREDLAAAVEAMRRASAEDIRERLVEALARAARSESRFRHGELLTDPGWLSAAVGRLQPDVYEGLTGGNISDLLRTLFIFDESAEAAGKR